MKLDKPIILATRNEGKVLEFRKLLADFQVEIKSLNDFRSLPPIIEDGKTFDDNAYKKAYFTAKVLGYPALADDSGLMVDALKGEPGVYSARYAGKNATDEENNAKLLEAMEGITRRNAKFMCVISIAVPTGPALTYEGSCEGEIALAPQGDGGFGYDPLFYYPPLKKTFAQISIEDKNRISHRGTAMAELRDEFDKVIIWLSQRFPEGHQ